MKLFGYWTVLVALSISAVAAYYSIVGLVAIFASAVIPIIIMGSVLEVGKLTSAVWLHLNWKAAPILIKTYLTVAVVVLMFITSMGIFGFLSKAHIEQTSMATENVAQIERINENIARTKVTISTAEDKIVKLDNVDNSLDAGIQDKIRIEEDRINTAYAGVQPSIDEQNKIVADQQKLDADRLLPFTRAIESVDRKLALLEEYSINNEVTKMQGLIGVAQDGRIGYNTREALKKFKEDNAKARRMSVYQLNNISNNDNTIIKDARAEIKRVRGLAEQQIADSNALITRLRAQLGQGQQQDLTSQVLVQRSLITDSENKLEGLYTTKYSLEGESRKLEAEVGPVKYIAELVYGADPTRSTLEETVRYVILLLVFVFDPLAVVLVISGISGLAKTRKPKPKENNERQEPSNNKDDKSPKDVSSLKKNAVGNKKNKTTIKQPVIENEILAEEVIHKDEDNREYTIDATGKINYLLDEQQWELNSAAYNELKKR